MKMQNIPFTVTNWERVTLEEYKGETGTSFWQTFKNGDIRVRKIEYSPGYRADHWCSKGHILLVLEGELIIQLKDGQEYTLTQGKSFQAGDDESNPHLAYTDRGAKVFIVD
ncbi:MAG: DHCW motif cupin fold protein [Candidatus Aminicenantes bacterium]|nr:DHCW motif cupin fold protein [Candidatus Aminicenantes bacterium]